MDKMCRLTTVLESGRRCRLNPVSKMQMNGADNLNRSHTLGLELHKDDPHPVFWLPRGSPVEYVEGTVPGRVNNS